MNYELVIRKYNEEFNSVLKKSFYLSFLYKQESGMY